MAGTDLNTSQTVTHLVLMHLKIHAPYEPHTMTGNF